MRRIIPALQAQAFMASAMGMPLSEISARMQVSSSYAAQLLRDARKKAIHAGLHFTCTPPRIGEKESGFSGLKSLACEAKLPKPHTKRGGFSALQQLAAEAGLAVRKEVAK